MASLVSPGVSVTVEDQSFYAAAGTGTVPFILIATEQDKVNADGSGIAAGTTAAEAGKVKLITSQRDLIAQFGNPIFKTDGGTALHGHELNEYGLMAAYSFLGLANRAYIIRADLDLGALEGSSAAPVAAPAVGSYWLDTSSSLWGLKAWNSTTQKWEKVEVSAPAPHEVNPDGSPLPGYLAGTNFAVSYWDDQGNTLSEIKLYERITSGWQHIGSAGWDAGSKDFQVARHTSLPTTQSGGGALVNGDLVLQVNAPNNGSNPTIRVFNGTSFVSVDEEGFEYSSEAFAWFHANGGVSAGDLFVDFASDVATAVIRRHNGLKQTVAESTAPFAAIDTTTHTGVAFNISINDSFARTGDVVAVSLQGFGAAATAADVVNGINNGIVAAQGSGFALANDLVASVVDGKVRIVSKTGYNIELLSGAVLSFSVEDINMVQGVAYSNWETLSYESSATEITGELADGTLWYDNLISEDHIDILVNDPVSGWVTFGGDVNLAASTPTVQSGGASLAVGDIWIDTSDLENYPQVNRWTGTAWVALDETDQESSDGILFADFRSDVASVTMDDDAPNAEFYPFGMIAWNKRASGGNVKRWDLANARWEDASGNREDGSPYMMRRARRAMVVRAMQSAVSSSMDIRNESNRFNLITAPGYPELLDELVALNVDRKETAFVISDAPMRLAANASSIQAWANNENNAVENGEDGLMTYNPYVGVYYPHGLTSDLSGNNVVVPASHIALRTLGFNDQVAFPWFAPAGFQRGLVSNATSVGYIDAKTSEYVPVSLSEGQRDTLYINKINPIGNFPGRGLAVFGQKTLNPIDSALDRVNVARLVVYIRERLDDIVKPFLFEPNDEITRQNAKVTVDRFLGNLVTQRGLYDFVTVCDTSNNTPDRIDRNELHIDIAIQPVKAVEFIYIPIRIQNTLAG